MKDKNLIPILAVCLAFVAAPVASASEIQQPPQAVVERVGNLLSLICDNLWIETDTMWHRGEFQRCIAVMKAITEIDPRDVDAFSNAAWLIWSEGDDEAAVKLYEKGLALNTDRFEMYYDLGMHHYSQKRYEEAIRVLESGRSLAPPVVYWKLLAHSYERVGRLEDSVSTWQRVTEMAPDDPAAGMNLSRVRQKAAEPPGPAASTED